MSEHLWSHLDQPQYHSSQQPGSLSDLWRTADRSSLNAIAQMDASRLTTNGDFPAILGDFGLAVGSERCTAYVLSSSEQPIAEASSEGAPLFFELSTVDDEAQKDRLDGSLPTYGTPDSGFSSFPFPELPGGESAAMDAAGIWGAKFAHSLTKMTAIEWGGLIYRDSDNAYHVSLAVTNRETGMVDTAAAGVLVPSWATIIADYHSHPVAFSSASFGYNPPSVRFTEGTGWRYVQGRGLHIVMPENSIGDSFSGYDKESARGEQRVAYLSDPSGNIEKYTPPPNDGLLRGPSESLTRILP